MFRHIPHRTIFPPIGRAWCSWSCWKPWTGCEFEIHLSCTKILVKTSDLDVCDCLHQSASCSWDDNDAVVLKPVQVIIVGNCLAFRELVVFLVREAAPALLALLVLVVLMAMLDLLALL